MLTQSYTLTKRFIVSHTIKLYSTTLYSVVLFFALAEPCYSAPKEPSINGLSAGLAVMRFDTKIKITPNGQQIPYFLDLEGNLKLPATNHVTTLGYEKRYCNRYWNLNYFSINRYSDFFADEITINGEEIANVNVNLKDKTRFYGFTWGSAIVNNKHSQVNLELGLFTADMSIDANFYGEQYLSPNQGKEYEYREYVEFIVPLPLLGINFMQSITPKWTLSTQISTLIGATSTASAGIVSTNISTSYAVTQQWYLLFKIGYFDLKAKNTKPHKRQELEYGYAGAGLGLRYAFK